MARQNEEGEESPERLGNEGREREEEEEEEAEEDDAYMAMVQFRSIRNEDALEEAVTLHWPGAPKSLHISTLLEEDDLAPLFAGAQWAGTRLWHAAICLFQYLDDQQKPRIHENSSTINAAAAQRLTDGTRVLELGCGLGVPGMLCRQVYGTQTYLTDQQSIMSQLTKNVATNFPDDPDIRPRPLHWSREAARDLLRSESIDHFDVVLNCDCVYEPLYGKSWQLLADVNDELLRQNPSALVLSSMERRNADAVDEYVERMRQSDAISEVKLVWSDPQVNIEIYQSIGL